MTISTTSAGATIYYTTNGTTPTKSSTEYTAPIPVSTTTTIQAIAVASGFFDSTVSSATYTIGSATATATPVFSLASGTYSSAQNVTISDATPGAAIYYTTNGTAPTTASTLYVGAITVSSSETIKAIAVAPAYSQSAVATAAYTITSSTEPDFSLTAASASMAIPFGGQGTSVITVTPKNGFASAVQLSCSVSGPAPMPTCAFSPTSVTPGASAVTSTLTIAVPTATAMVLPSSSAPFGKFLYATAWIPMLFGITLVGGLRKKGLHNWALGSLLALLLFSLAACGSVTSSNHTPQTKSYVVTVVVTPPVVRVRFSTRRRWQSRPSKQVCFRRE